MAAMPIYMYGKKLGQNQLTYDLETWYVALGIQVFPRLFKILCPPAKGEREHIGFSADPIGIDVGVGATDSCTHDIS